MIVTRVTWLLEQVGIFFPQYLSSFRGQVNHKMESESKMEFVMLSWALRSSRVSMCHPRSIRESRLTMAGYTDKTRPFTPPGGINEDHVWVSISNPPKL